MLSELLHRYKTLVAAILLSALAASAGLPARATLNGLAVEQARAEMPYIYVYCYDAAGTLADSTAEGYLDGRQLAFSGAEPAEEFGTSYIFLVDISGSIRADYFTAVKEQLTAFALGLGAEDDFTLITFGDEVKLLAAGSGYSAELEETINGLAGRDQHTHLYDAIASGVAYAQAQDTAARQVMVIVSDGLEAKESVGTTLQEAQQQLEGADIPVYSLCVDYAGADEQERFSSFARTTGGSFYAFGAQDAEQAWQEFAQEVKSCRRLTFENSDNMADGKTHTLLLKYRQGEAEESYTLSVALDRWLPDETAPLVESAGYDQQSNSLTVRFSEPVTGAGNPAAYHITDGKQEYTAQSVSRQGDDYLVLLPQLKPGEYTVSYTDIFDCSMERNPLDVKELTFRRRLVWADIYIWVLCGLLLIILIVVLIYRRFRKKQPANEAPVPEPEAAQPAEQSVQQLQITPKPVAQPPTAGAGTVVTMRVAQIDGGRIFKTQELSFEGSCICGRNAAMCDFCLPDGHVSGQHCAFEYANGVLTITDLGSQNGTYLNGIRLTAARAVHTGDTLRLGDTQIRVQAVLTGSPGGNK